jgi:hypothetical protein
MRESVMKTDAGVKLTPEEIKAVKALKKACKLFEGTRLFLYNNSTMYVMMTGDLENNPHPKINADGGMNQNNIICSIDGIYSDGGDW